MTHAHSSNDLARGFQWLLRVPIDPMTYRSLGYLLISMPLGLAYFVTLTVGMSLSIGLMVLLIGPIVFLGTLLFILGLAWFDGILTAHLLQAEVSMSFPSTESLRTFLTDLVIGRQTWFGLLFIGWKSMLGLVAFMLLVLGGSISLSLLLLPLHYGDGVYLIPLRSGFEVSTLSASLWLATIGASVGYLTLVASNGLGHLTRAIAEQLLVAE